MTRVNGGRGLKRIKTLFESRILSVSQHPKLNSKRSQLLQYINKRIQVSKDLPKNNNINIDILEKHTYLSKYTRKIMLEYFQRKLQNDANIDMKTSQYRTRNKTMALHFAGYLNSVIDQEVPAKYIQHKQKCDRGQVPTIKNKCRWYYTNAEDITQISAVVKKCLLGITCH